MGIESPKGYESTLRRLYGGFMLLGLVVSVLVVAFGIGSFALFAYVTRDKEG
jgi:hypothetical protein